MVSITKCILPFFGSDARLDELAFICREVRHGVLDKLAALPRFNLREGYVYVHDVFVAAER